MDTNAKAAAFKALHIKGQPLVLWNVWDAGSAKAVAKAGAPALATGSWSVAAAMGAQDGQCLPMEDALRTARQVVQAVDLPVSVDFEGCYADTPDAVAQNVGQLIQTGAIGMNYEDRAIGGTGLHDMDAQAACIAAARRQADAAGTDFFINARTDVFFAGSDADPADMLAELLARAAAYADAGADGLFVPGLADPDLVAKVCATVRLPVNVMRIGEEVPISAYAEAGVARISHGPGPYRAAMQALTQSAAAYY